MSVVTAYLNFKGRVRPPPGLRMGPTTYGAILYVVGSIYDSEIDMTHVAMSPVAPRGEHDGA